MTDKFLTEAHWKGATKGKELTAEADVLKAMGQLARAEKGKPGAATLASQRDALDAIDKATTALEKANAKVVRADKTLVALLADVAKAVERARKELDHQAKELDEAKAKADAQADAEEDEAPDILTTRMIPLLRQVRQGEQMQAKLAVAGRELVVMLSRKSISPARKKLMAEMLEQKSSIKVVDGTCILENKFVTFVLNNPAAGMAKRISAALLKQTGLRVPVRVRGPEGDVDEDDDGDAADAPSEDKAQAKTDSAERGKALAEQLKALLLKVQKALADKHPHAAAIKLSASEAGALIRQSRWDAAAQVMQALEEQLAGPGTARPKPQTSQDAPPKQPATGRFVNHIQARLAWVSVRKKLSADLQSLEGAILDYCKTQPDLSAEATAKVRKLGGILNTLDDRLTETLDKALGAPDDRQRLVMHEQARKVLSDYIAFVKTDALLDGIDKNPFVPLKTREFMLSSLQTIDKSLP